MVIAVRCHPITSTFNRQGCKVGIRNQVAFDTADGTEPAENLPMAGTGIDDDAVGLISKFAGKRQGFLHAAGRVKDARMGHDAKKAAQDKVGNSIGVIRPNQFFEPGKVLPMAGRIFAMSIDKDIDIKKNHEVVP